MIEFIACPFPLSLQDRGRAGYRHLGVPLSGALDPHWLALANALAGAEPHAAALEMRLLGPTLRTESPTVFAIAGAVDAQITDEHGSRTVAPWRGHALLPGQQLRVGAVRSGVAYLAFAGGLAGQAQLGSRSGYARAGLGSAIAPGVRLGVATGTGPLWQMPAASVDLAAPIRVLPGPQRDHFPDAAWEQLLAETYEVGRDSDRMGLRLRGAALPHRSPAHADTLSEAVTPGVVQVPADGKPIVLLADCQTVGGYPKIAVVIGADLRRLGHALPGQRLRFAAVTLEQALQARCDAEADVQAQLQQLRPCHDGPDLDALYAVNLIDGMIYAD